MHHYDVLTLQLGVAACSLKTVEISEILARDFNRYFSARSNISAADKILPSYLFPFYSMLTDEISLIYVMMTCINSKMREENPVAKEESVSKQALFSLMNEVMSLLPIMTPIKEITQNLEFVCSDDRLLKQFCEERMQMNMKKQRLELKAEYRKSASRESGSEPLLWWQVPKLHQNWKSKHHDFYTNYIGNFNLGSKYSLLSVVKKPTNLARINQLKFQENGDHLVCIMKNIIEPLRNLRYPDDHCSIIYRLITLLGAKKFDSIRKDWIIEILGSRTTEMIYNKQFFSSVVLSYPPGSKIRFGTDVQIYGDSRCKIRKLPT
jgi:hypothetical protein